MFAFFAAYFLYSFTGVEERERLSNETTTWALFISILFACVSYITVQQKDQLNFKKKAES